MQHKSRAAINSNENGINYESLVNASANGTTFDDFIREQCRVEGPPPENPHRRIKPLCVYGDLGNYATADTVVQ